MQLSNRGFIMSQWSPCEKGISEALSPLAAVGGVACEVRVSGQHFEPSTKKEITICDR